jgi:Mor family transcriptional regulator
MSLLSNKYNIPETTVKQMIKDGLFYSKVVMKEDIDRLLSEGKKVPEIAAIFNCDKAYIYRILRETK